MNLLRSRLRVAVGGMAASAALLLGFPGHSSAAACLQWFAQDGSGTSTSGPVCDGQAQDLNPGVGIITLLVNGAGGWNFNVETGFSKPAVGSATRPELDIVFSAMSTGAGSLAILLWDTDFLLTGEANGSLAIGGTGAAGASVTQRVGYNGTNGGGPWPALASQSFGPFGSGATPFSGAVSATYEALTAPYSLAMDVTITHRSAGITTGNASFSVPEPGSFALAGLALLGLAAAGRRKVGT